MRKLFSIHTQMKKSEAKLLKKAIKGDINAYQQLFGKFQDQLKSYLFRLMANRADAEDIAHDTFIKAFDKLNGFNQQSSLKTWVFQIATHQAYNELKKRKRWTVTVKSEAKELVQSRPELAEHIQRVHSTSEYGKFEIKEHIDTCFTCMSKTLPIENQVTIILKDIYDFTVPEIMKILDESEGTIKYSIQRARSTLNHIFEERCAFINKNGICNQCSELNGWMNPKQNAQEEKMKIRMIKNAGNVEAEKLLALRIELVKNINPLKSNGHELQEVLLNCNRMVMKEIKAG